MPGTQGSRRTATLLGTILIAIVLSAGPASGGEPDPDCERRPFLEGCSTATTEGGTNERPPATEETPNSQVNPGVPPKQTTSTTKAANDEEENTGGNDPDVDRVADKDTDDGGISPLFALLAGLLGLGAGFAGGAAVMAARKQNAGAASAPVAATEAVAVAVPANLDGAERGRLVQELINVRDQVSSEALKASIGATLAEVGVTELLVRPGEPFDPQRHKGVDRIHTTDAALDRTVAETERPGYVDRDQVVRLPEVVVHRLDAQAGPS